MARKTRILLDLSRPWRKGGHDVDYDGNTELNIGGVITKHVAYIIDRLDEQHAQ